MDSKRTDNRNFDIFNHVLQWAESDDAHHDSIIQFKKGTTQEFTFSNKNGRFRRFMARIINFFSKKDYFDEKNIGNSKRQKQVADLFHEQLKSKRKNDVTIRHPPNKLTLKYVRRQLRDAGWHEHKLKYTNYPPPPAT